MTSFQGSLSQLGISGGVCLHLVVKGGTPIFTAQRNVRCPNPATKAYATANTNTRASVTPPAPELPMERRVSAQALAQPLPSPVKVEQPEELHQFPRQDSDKPLLTAQPTFNYNFGQMGRTNSTFSNSGRQSRQVSFEWDSLLSGVVKGQMPHMSRQNTTNMLGDTSEFVNSVFQGTAHGPPSARQQSIDWDSLLNTGDASGARKQRQESFDWDSLLHVLPTNPLPQGQQAKPEQAVVALPPPPGNVSRGAATRGQTYATTARNDARMVENAIEDSASSEDGPPAGKRQNNGSGPTRRKDELTREDKLQVRVLPAQSESAPHMWVALPDASNQLRMCGHGNSCCQ